MLQKILVLIIILLIKAIFTAGDTALTYINKAKISQESKKNRRAKKIKEFSKNTAKFYGAMEVGITLTELIATAFAAEAFVYPLAYNLQQWNIPHDIATVFSLIIITLILSYVLLVFGSILPKRIARNHPEKTAYRLINILWLFSKINYPFERLIHASTKFLTILLGIDNVDKQELTEKEIKMTIAEGKDQGILSQTEKEIVYNALKFNDILVKNIMIPKEKIDFINYDQPTEEIFQNISKHPYTRLPVYKGDENNVIRNF